MVSKTDDLHCIANKKCLKDCNPQERKVNTNNGLCTITESEVDGLSVRCVGEWAYQKIYFVTRYFNIFSKGMKNRWAGINYIEIGSGPGRCVQQKTGEEIDGTALAIVQDKAFEHIGRALFIDNNDQVVADLNERIKKVSASEKALAVNGDYTRIEDIKQILMSRISKGCLNLVFIDPTDCSISFELIRMIKNSLDNVDLIVNFAIGTDMTRNISNAISDSGYQKTKAKYEDFIGTPGFLETGEIIDSAQYGDHSALRQRCIDEFVCNLGEIGFQYTAQHSVQHYYRLIFASANEKGLQFWQKIDKIQPSGQRRLL